MRRLLPWALLLLPAVASGLFLGCRDDVDPFDPGTGSDGREPALVRLTTSLGDDRAPSWSAGGDSVYYSAEGFDHLPPDPGVLVGLPRSGGVTRPILRNVQTENELDLERWLVAPTLSPDGDRLAFVEISTLWPRNPCTGAVLSCDPARDSVPLPPLRHISLRVRRPTAVGPLEGDPELGFFVPGVVVDTVILGNVEVPRFNVRFLPHQRLFETSRRFTFRPSWDPAGERLVFSDGTRLLIWAPGEEAAAEVPGTMGAHSAAWSPDGEWIAFTRRVSTDSTHTSCSYLTLFGPCAFVEYTEFTPARAALRRIRPDGTGLTELGTGQEPAWGPDGTLYFVRDGRIWQRPPGATEAEPVPETEDGREPAVSPDGRFLAFARFTSPGNHDIWVLRLAP